MKFPIYFDYNSTTPIDPAVLEEMMPYLKEKFGNPSSRTHSYGLEAEIAVDIARKKVADLIGASIEEIIFTGSATESINLAIKGFIEGLNEDNIHIITTKIEHAAVLNTCKYVEQFGHEVTYLNVDGNGLIDIDELKSAIKSNTKLITIQTANNEIGTIQPISEIGKLCSEHKIVFHTDASQAVGKIPINVDELYIDMLSFSGHKIYGPKGIGVLFIKKKTPAIKLKEQIHGGGQEKSLRSGTLNVPAIVGLGKACEICKKTLYEESIRLTVWRDRIINNVKMRIENSYLNGHLTKRLPTNINFSFKNIDNIQLLREMKEIAFSTGSACSSESSEPSHTLIAIGRSPELIRGSVRFGLGRFNTDEEIEYLLKSIVSSVTELRRRAGFFEEVYTRL
ncbi:MAG: cysteine desulfurase family protein [Ignavibacteria bacterium]